MILVEEYSEQNAPKWDAFVRAARNGTFLMERSYVSYHQDRFLDCSLIFKDQHGEWLAVLPANRAAESLVSHGGLTYGGFVLGDEAKTPHVVEAFRRLRDWMRLHGLEILRYKPLPFVYARSPSQEDLFALTANGARLIRRDVLSVVDLRHRLPFQARRTRGVNRAKKEGVSIREDDALLPAYWGLLEENLQSRHQAKPVHTLPEISRLRQLFPNHIKLFTAHRGNNLLGGVLIFESQQVARSQYIASSIEGRDCGALDLLFMTLLETTYSEKPFFDFGSSMQAPGALDVGLIEQKEGFGARSVALDTYELCVSEDTHGLS